MMHCHERGYETDGYHHHHHQTCLWCIAMKVDMMSMGTGKTMVLLFSAEMLFKVWRYLSWV